jgi:AraC family transcriptional regulator
MTDLLSQHPSPPEQGCFRGHEARAMFGSSAERGIPEPAVKISPEGAARRHSVSWHGLTAESIYAPAASRIECQFRASFHLLVMYIDGVRSDGETSIDGLTPSTLRNIAKKLTFVPANHAYTEWHETRAPMRISYLYLDPCRFSRANDANSTGVAKAFFADPVVWDTAIKLKAVIENGRSDKSYVDALTNVLAHELLRLNQKPLSESATSRGGLAGWQRRIVAQHIEKHLSKKISLATLAELCRLSPYHFCRAFKHSFGVPPHEYHIQRRIEKAKFLLAERQASVTNVGLALGYSHTSSFSVAFRKVTGRPPRLFRRDLV